MIQSLLFASVLNPHSAWPLLSSPCHRTGVNPDQFQSSGDVEAALGVLSEVTGVPRSTITATLGPAAAAAAQTASARAARKLLQQQVRLQHCSWQAFLCCVGCVQGSCCQGWVGVAPQHPMNSGLRHLHDHSIESPQAACAATAAAPVKPRWCCW